jgi:exodeoxyribonuclease VII large subunit
VTISDYVADRRASTPSNAAEIAVPDCREIEELLSAYELRASQGMRKQLNNLRERLDSCAGRRVLTDPMTLVDNRRMELDRSRERLAAAEEKILAGKRQRFVAATAKLDAMSPLKVLTRGYAITHDEKGNSIRSAEQLHSGDKITLRLSDGSADCLVEDVRRSTT